MKNKRKIQAKFAQITRTLKYAFSSKIKYILVVRCEQLPCVHVVVFVLRLEVAGKGCCCSAVLTVWCECAFMQFYRRPNTHSIAGINRKKVFIRIIPTNLASVQ